MAEIEHYGGNSNAIVDETEQGDGDVMNSGLFVELKNLCVQLLDLLQNSNKNPSFLSQLLHLLQRSSPPSLQPFLDYTLFPLLLLFDASVNCRSSMKSESKNDSQVFIPLETEHKVRDSVAEGVVLCLEEVLKKCHLGSVDQMAVILRKLTHGAMLSPPEASEEFREGVIRCFRAVLLNLCPCSNNYCPCKQIAEMPVLQSEKELKFPVPNGSKYNSVSKECSIAFLQSEPASAAIGHWLSLMLKAADIEATRGQRGSSRIRVEALIALRVLVAKVGIADALAFYMPGVISQLGKVLHASRSMISGAAGSTKALDQAIRALAEYIIIVLGDEVSTSICGVPGDDISGSFSSDQKPLASFLEDLRHLPVKTIKQDDARNLTKSVDKGSIISGEDNILVNTDTKVGPLHINRTADWLAKTTAHVNKLLSATFPHLCVHPNKKVRQGVLTSVQSFLCKCSYTLKESRLMLLECLFVLVCDDSEDVSSDAQAFLRLMVSSKGKFQIEHDISELFSRLLEKLPQVVLGNEEPLAISHAQKLLAITYFAGPRLVADYLFLSPEQQCITSSDHNSRVRKLSISLYVTPFPIIFNCLRKMIKNQLCRLLPNVASTCVFFSYNFDQAILIAVTTARFVDVFASCLSQNSVFAGSLNKLAATRTTSSGFLPSISEIQAITSSENSRFLVSQKSKDLPRHEKNEYELPSMPPWFVNVGSRKLYQTLSGILRLVSLYMFTDSRSEGSYSGLIDILLGHLHKLIAELRMKELHTESWQSWYTRSISGNLVRQASTAVCILNEMVFGLSDQAITSLNRMFRSGLQHETKGINGNDIGKSCEHGVTLLEICVQKMYQNSGARSHLIDCIGNILHEYLSTEVWNLPLDFSASHLQCGEDGDISFHVFNDNAMLHQAIIEGIGVFNICLGKEFSSSGFLHSSLYMLLENIICSNFQVRRAADSVLHVISATQNCPTVGHLVLENSDYVIDSICRQLRHLDVNPHVPNVLATILSFVGIADKILPLLEEPMRAVSLELEILGRHRHPILTLPFLKAVAEVAKASKNEAYELPNEAELHKKDVNLRMLTAEARTEMNSGHSRSNANNALDIENMDYGNFTTEEHMQEEWKSIIFKFNDSKRYRRIVGSIAGSCLVAATPLVASADSASCLKSLDVIEDGIMVLAKVEEAYKQECQTKEAIEQAIQSCSLYNLLDTLGVAEDETVENRLLPGMNKIWPCLIACLRNKNPVAIRKCSQTISNVVQICGGEFFSRRFHTDGIHIWRLLSSSPFQKKPLERTLLQLPYRKSSTSSEDSQSEISNLKVQVSLLSMISDIAGNKRSAPSLDAVLKKVSGIVIGIVCSGVKGLQDACVNALVGLASIDPDLIWLLLADVYYSRKKNLPPSPSADFPEMTEILPPPSSSREYLYVLYAGQSYGFDVDFDAVGTVLDRLNAQVFT